jgi:AcrR family transcriptional regulator
VASSSQTGRRAENRRQTLDALRDAGLELFAEQGFTETTVEQIAATAGVSLRTFFRYFSCKEALLFGTDMRDKWESLLRGRPAGEPLLVSLQAADRELWNSGREAGEPRRALRRRLIQTTPSVQAYGRRLVMDSAPVVAAIAAERLGIAADDGEDLRPMAFAGVCAALAIFLFEYERPLHDSQGMAEEWLGAAAALFGDLDPA